MHSKRVAVPIFANHTGRPDLDALGFMAADCRQLGLGRLLVEHSLAKLKDEGINRCTIFCRVGNETGEVFWKRLSFHERSDLKSFARDL